MSRNDWEFGKIVIPQKTWPSFKKALRSGYNALLEKDLIALNQIHALLPKTAVSSHNEADLAVQRIINDRNISFHTISRWNATGLLFTTNAKGYFRPCAVRKSALPFNNAKSRIITFAMDASIILSEDKEHSVSWVVPENNKAVDEARASGVGKLFFQRLKEVEWTRHTGGIISGNDEFNQESRDSGYGGNYTSFRCGPIGSTSSY